MAIQTIDHQVGGAAHAPTRPLDAARDIKHFTVGLDESDIEIIEHRLPIPGRFGIGPPHQVVEIVQAVTFEEGNNIRVASDRFRRMPSQFGVHFFALGRISGEVLRCFSKPSRYFSSSFLLRLRN